MFLRLEFSDGRFEILRDTWHPLFQSPFVRNIVEMDDADNNTQVNIPLPNFIEYERMAAFSNFLYNCAAGEHVELGFGKHASCSYLEVYLKDRDYYEWARSQTNPSEEMEAWLDWMQFYQMGSKPAQEEIPRILPIAKFFQIDMCAHCARLGSPPARNGAQQLKPCRRTGWPKIPVVPEWNEVTRDSEEGEKVTDWRRAWERADRERQEVPCSIDDMLCEDCRGRKGCQVCKEYECDPCQLDAETPKTFQKWHEKNPWPENEDEYGRRGECAFKSMNTSRCLGCGRRICQGCGTECQDCHRRACDGCKEDLNTWCSGCRGTIENNDDSAIGPIDREEYVCRPCFVRRPHYCGCGEPSYDPEEPDDNGQEDFDASDVSDENQFYDNQLYGEDWFV